MVGLGDSKNSMSRYIMSQSNYHDNRYYHDIILANQDSITSTKSVTYDEILY